MNYNQIMLKDITVPSEWYSDDYILVDIVPAYEYVKNLRTNKIVGYRYEILLRNYKNIRCRVLIEHESPLSEDSLFKSVTFKNLELLFYYSKFYGNHVRIRGIAEDIEVVNKEEIDD